MSDADLWAIARAGYRNSKYAAETPWEAVTAPHRYCWYLGAVYLTKGNATLQGLRRAIQPNLDIKPWTSLTILEVQLYRNIYGAMLSTSQRITARTRVAA